MIITDRFVFIHLPKTGGTFVASVFNDIYKRIKKKTPHKKMMFEHLLFPNIKRLHCNTAPDQHGTFEQIPFEHKSKPVMAVTRNPYDRYVSAYFFRDYERNPEAEVEKIRKIYPYYPNMTFEEFLRYSNEIGIKYRPFADTMKSDIDVLSFQFIQMLIRTPQKAFKDFDDDYIESSG